MSLAGIYGAITTFFAVKKLWFLLLQFVNSTGFDKKDPLYSIDISFYVFKLTFIEEANQLLIVLLIAFALLTVIYYSVLLSVRTPQIFDGYRMMQRKIAVRLKKTRRVPVMAEGLQAGSSVALTISMICSASLQNLSKTAAKVRSRRLQSRRNSLITAI